ncbi:MAG: PrsW family intramembrane metalloprotease [Anaerolineae bacterium]|nr:PrsW family intramembrane metalloprotease [Anaerolineae bacterium]
MQIDDKMQVEALPKGWKRTIMILGLCLALPGIPLALGYCLVLLISGSGYYSDSDVQFILGILTLTVVTLGAGGAAAWHGRASLNGRPSKSLRLPPIWALVGLFSLFVAWGYAVTTGKAVPVLVFPPVLLIAAALPSLWAVAWFTRGETGGLTWRRGSVAFAGGATAGVLLAIILEILLPGLLFALVDDLAQPVLDELEWLLRALVGRDVAGALTGWGFFYAFIMLAVIAPLAEEFAKPLVTLPLVKRLPRREAFLVGALAGAGFAALENVIYASSGYSFWVGILVVRALGGAIHPLGAGLVALAWRDVLCKEPHAGRDWLKRFGLAAGMHALWNGGSLLVITLAGAEFFGDLPPEIDVLGLSAGGTTFALLIILVLVALWLGRTIAQQGKPVGLDALVLPGDAVAPDARFVLSDRAVAIWALACLAALVPLGITGLKLVLR